jgi:hypothetical protein
MAQASKEVQNSNRFPSITSEAANVFQHASGELEIESPQETVAIALQI